MKRRFLQSPTMLILITACFSTGADWTRFRGPGGSGTSDEQGLPTKWSARENIVWRTELPGPGTSSPVTLGQRVYLTCYSGYGLDVEEPGDMDKLMRHVVCLDRETGKIVWTKQFEPKLPESKYRPGNSSRHGYSSSTPTTDGERLYVFFGKSGVFCLDLDGEQLWQADVGSSVAGWGTGNSLTLYKNLVIVNASVESRSLVALDKISGDEVWRTEGFRGVRNTPILLDLPEGQTELVVNSPGRPVGHLLGLDPASGEELWRCEAIPDRGYVVPSVVAYKGIVYAIGGRQNTALAVRAGGRGDVTEKNRLWLTGKGSNVSSPVYHDGHLYWAHERRGVAYCLDAVSGQVVYEERLSPRPGLIYSSTLLADGKLYCVSQTNGTYVLAAKPEFEQLAHNVFEDDNSRTNTAPVVSNAQLLLRNDRYLYCIGKK